MKPITLFCLALIAISYSAKAEPHVTATYYQQESVYHFDFAVLMEDPVYGSGTLFEVDSTLFSNMIAPVGWETWSDFRSTKWTTRYPEYRIPPGATLYGCSATASVVPANMRYIVGTTGPVTTYWGTLIPQAIPEPSSLLALAGGLGAVGFPLIRRRRR